MVEELENIWSLMRKMEVFRLHDFCRLCNHEFTPRFMAGYVVALCEAGYIVELSGKRRAVNQGKGVYRLMRDTGEEAPILQNGITLLYGGRYVRFDHAVYDPNLDTYFPLIKEGVA